MGSSYLFLNNLRVHYLHWDPKSDGKPVVLLHGLASNARIWELVAPILLHHGLNPFAYDQRGHGLTDKPDGDYGFETFSQDLAAFLEACNLERPVLVGHSWGAWVALDFAARFSVGPLAPSALVMVDGGTHHWRDDAEATWEMVSQRLKPPPLAGMRLSTFLKNLNDPQRSWIPDERAASIILGNFEIREDELDIEHPNGSGKEEDEGRIYPNLSLEHHMQILRAMWDFDIYPHYRRLRCPVLLVSALPPGPYGPEEEAYIATKRKGVARLQQIAKNLTLIWMPDTIHDIPLQKPDELGEIMGNFINRNVQENKGKSDRS
jgi:pimeloyl-ACP methyl ester carboxylesterase